MGERDTSTDDDEGVYHLDVEGEEQVDVDELTREALAAVAGAKGAAEGASEPAADVSTDPDVAELQAELAELRDRSIRTLADF